MAPSKDPESGEKKNIKRTLSSGKLLVDDPGWLGPFNRLVWAYPNSILYSLLILGAVIFVLMKQAHHSTNAFVGAAIVEVLLSTDNICLFHQIFEHFRVPREVRPGLLFVGTPFMVLMRWSLFFALKGIYDSLRPLMFALGLFCAYQGLVVFYMTCMGLEEEDEDPENSAMVIWFKKIMGDKLITKYQGSAFHVTLDGIGKYTPMFLVLMFIEVTDVAFCIDGVSTIFMVDHVHVWTLFLGDIVAACIVRALYPQLAGTVELFPDLNYSVACVLVMVGADMCCGVFGYDFPPGTLAVSMGVLFTLGMASSILRGTCRNPDEEDEAAKNKDQGAYGAA